MQKLIRTSENGRRRTGGLYVLAPRTATLVAVLGAGVAVMGAQTNSAAALYGASQRGTAQIQPSMDIQFPAKDSLFSTSASEQTDDAPAADASVVPAVPNFEKMMGYAGAQGHKPRYRSGFTNDDGSGKLMFYFGAGGTLPVNLASDYTNKYMTPSYGFQVGGGWQFSKKFALPVEFDFDHFGLTGSNIAAQTVIYDKLFGKGAVNGLLNGGTHVISLSIDPTYSFRTNDSFGVYAVGGFGYYHKVTNFTVPSLASFCGGGYGFGGYGYGYGGFGYGGYGYGGCGTFVANQAIDMYTSNAPGINGGIGLTYRFSRFASEQLYAEARYVYIFDSYRPGITLANDTAITTTTTNFYPANSIHTGYMPFKLGIRF